MHKELERQHYGADVEPMIDFVKRAEIGSKQEDGGFPTRRVAAYLSSAELDMNPEDLDVAGFEITYSFSHHKRSNVVGTRTYGNENWSYRELYEFLCAVFNKREYFIDSYLKNEFRHTGTFDRFSNMRRRVLKHMADELKAYKGNTLQNAQGRFAKQENMQTADLKREAERIGWQDFSVWRDGNLKTEVNDIARDIRDNIINALSTGQLPLNHQNTEETAERRRRLGLTNTEQVFFATERLIRHMDIFIAMDREAA